MDETKLLIRKIIICAGLLFILISIIGGISIIVFSFKFASGVWLVWWKYMLAMLGLGIACMLLTITGILMIYIAVDTNKEKK